MKKHLLLLTFALFQNVVFSQKEQPVYLPVSECGTDYLPENRKGIDENFEKYFNDQLHTAQKNNNQTIRIIPVVFHVFHTGEPVGEGANITNLQVYEALEKLNNDYSNTENISTSGSTNIKFVLATKDPEGNCSEGIVRINMDNNTTFRNYGVKHEATDSGVTYESLANLSRWNHHQYYNVYIVHKITSGSLPNIGGYAAYPMASGPSIYDRAVIKNSALGKSENTFTHEMGHALHLMHTFQGSNGDNCPAEVNGCGDTGDCVQDTPPHIKNHIADNDIAALNICTNQNNSVFKVNYMTYNYSHFTNSFTPQQIIRMESAYDNLRSYFRTSVNPFYIMNNAPEADFLINGQTSNIQFVCSGVPIKLINTSKCFLNTFEENSTITGYSTQWIVKKNGVTVITSTQTNPVIVLNETGDYSLTLNVTNAIGTSSKTINNIVKVINPSTVNYCQPTSYNIGFFGYSLSEISLGNLINLTPDRYNFGYTDFSCSKIAALSPQDTHQLKLKLSSGSSSSFAYHAYIDYNKNGVFEANELLGSGSVPASSSMAEKTISFTMKPNTTLDEVLRLRIITRPTSISPSEVACQSDLFVGDVEDYGVIFTNVTMSVKGDALEYFTIYPNPVSNILTIGNTQTTINVIKVFDLQGRKLKEIQHIDAYEYQLPVHNLPSGTYILHINNLQTKFVKK